MKKVILIFAALFAVTAADARERHHEKEREVVCKDTIKAAGDAFHIISSAKKSAIKRWQEQVINAHGEQYMNFDNAKIKDVRCDPARVGGGNTILDLKRCVVIARPCRLPQED